MQVANLPAQTKSDERYLGRNGRGIERERRFPEGNVLRPEGQRRLRECSAGCGGGPCLQGVTFALRSSYASEDSENRF